MMIDALKGECVSLLLIVTYEGKAPTRAFADVLRTDADNEGEAKKSTG